MACLINMCMILPNYVLVVTSNENNIIEDLQFSDHVSINFNILCDVKIPEISKPKKNFSNYCLRAVKKKYQVLEKRFK